MAYTAIASQLYFNQAAYVYHPEKEWTTTPKSIGIDYEEVLFSSTDGTRLSGWFVPAKESQATILFCHGNTGNISNELPPLKMYHTLGFSMFFFDYRGFGHSEGVPSEKGIERDAEAAMQYLLKVKKIPLKQIIILGRSFGGSVAAPLAVRYPAKALMLEATFTSLKDMGEKRYPIFPVDLLLRERYDSIHKIAKISSPVLVVHSRNDEVIPFEQGQRLYAMAPEPKMFLEISGPHDNRNDLVSQATYRQGIQEFLTWLEKR